ncbi:hypothetical protein ACRRTK_010853 [Alexandromys fortis]
MAGDLALCWLLVCPAVATTTVMSVTRKLGSVWAAKELLSRIQKRFQKPQEKLKALKEAASGLLSNHSEELQAAEELLTETQTKTQESNGLLLLIKASLRDQQPKFGKADSYEKLEKLGEGPYAAVYKGKSEPMALALSALRAGPVSRNCLGPRTPQMWDLMEPQPSKQICRMKNFVREFQQHRLVRASSSCNRQDPLYHVQLLSENRCHRNVEKAVSFRVLPLKGWCPMVIKQHYTQTPDICLPPIVPFPQNQFWSTVDLSLTAPLQHSASSTPGGEARVSQLYVALCIEQDAVWLQVSMDSTMAMCSTLRLMTLAARTFPVPFPHAACPLPVFASSDSLPAHTPSL